MKHLICLLVFLIAAEAIKAEEKQPSAAETAIRKVLHDQVTAWNKGDLAEFMAGYWNSKDLTFYSGKDKHQGWDMAFDRYKKRYQGEGKEMGKLSFSELEVQLLNAEFAVVKGRWNVEMKKETLNGLFTLIMKKTDQGWVIVHDHTSG
jgi:beta-aspartyl-peptidase (threonine type)